MRTLALVMAFLAVWSCAALGATNQSEGVCAQAFNNLISGQLSKQKLPAQIAYWKSKASHCAGTGLYEYRLANLYMRDGKYQAARKELQSALKRRLPHRRELLLGMSDLASYTNDNTEAQRYAEQVTHEYPHWYIGYRELGTVYIQEEKFSDAIRVLKKANRIEKNWFTYRTLVVAYYYTHQTKSAIAAFDEAYHLNSEVASDRNYMLLGANAYMNEGKFKIAHGVLLLLAKNDPAERSDPTFIKMYKAVESALQGK